MLSFPKDVKYREVFSFFEQISAIPRGSGHTDAIAAYLVDFAKARGLYVYRDAYDNVLIRKAATAGYEGHTPIVLQGHTDIVAVKTPDCEKDMDREGLDLYVDGDFLRARGTSLGADDGIAIAYALAILDSRDIAHPPLEALFTSDEEIGLIGAGGFDTSKLVGSTLINIDSDGEGVFTVGCAGGVRCDLTLPMQSTATDAPTYRLTVGDLVGGHSGVEIHRGRANALRVLGSCLAAVAGVRLVALSGGVADNAIATDAQATFVAMGDVRAQIEAVASKLRAQYAETDPDMTVALTEVKAAERAYAPEDSANAISLLTELPNGVIAMSEAIPTLVETSLNVGIASLAEDGFSLCISVRSSKEAAKDALTDTLASFVRARGGDMSMRGAYPAWEYRENSPLRDAACRVYERMYGKRAQSMVIHAGLECGVFAGKIRDFDSISLGPENHDLHTTEEHMSISSAVRVYEFLCELLAAL